MKHYFLFLVFAALLFGTSVPSFATVNTAATLIQPPADDHPKTIATMKLKEFQQLAGRRLSFKEKIGFLVMRNKIRHQKTSEYSMGLTAYILGFLGLGLLVIGLFASSGAVLIGSFVTAVVAVVTGSMAKKDGPDNRKAKAGKLLGWITIGAIGFLLILAAIVVASWGL